MTEIAPIQIQQNKAAQITTFDHKNPNKNTETYLKELNRLTIGWEIKYITYTKTYKIIKSDMDDKIKDLISKNNNNIHLQANNKLGNKQQKTYAKLTI